MEMMLTYREIYTVQGLGRDPVLVVESEAIGG